MKSVEAWGDTDYSHAVDAAWTDIDLSTLFGGDAGSVAGVVGVVHNTSAGILDFGVRKNGSSDVALLGEIPAGGGCQFAIGVDSNDIFECYLQDASGFDVYILGWFLTSEAEFLDSAVDKTLSLDATWEDFDVSAQFTGTALVAFMAAILSNVSHYGYQDDGGPGLFMLSLNEVAFHAVPLTSEVGEHYSALASRITSYVIGAVTDNVTILGTYDEHDLTSANTYEDNDLSAVIGAGSVAVICQMHDGDTSMGGGAMTTRPDGETFDIYPNPMHAGCPVIMPVKASNRIIEVKNFAIYADMYTLGYFTEPAAGGGRIMSSLTGFGGGLAGPGGIAGQHGGLAA